MGDRIRAICHVEREAYATTVLVARMEEEALDPAPVWDDIKTFDGIPWRGVVDLVTAGYPCQPFSLAGKGLAERDPRHLWPHVRRIIGECGPSLVFLENVPGHVKRGFASVVADLQRMGYVVSAGLFSAEEVGAPHRRQRLFALAYAGRHAAGQSGRGAGPGGSDSPVSGDAREIVGCPSIAVADAHSDGLQRQWIDEFANTARRHDVDRCDRSAPAFPPPQCVHLWADVPADSQPAVCRVADGLACRVERLQLCGNGVVPVVAAHAFLTLARDLGVM
jgi:DNA (cytosine-5)-methyltransferase 1